MPQELEETEGNNKTKSPTEDKGKHKHKMNDQTKSENSNGHYCILHGHCNHPSNKCRDLKKMFKKCKRTYSNSNEDSKKDYKPKQKKLMPWSLKPLRLIRSKRPKTKRRSRKN